MGANCAPAVMVFPEGEHPISPRYGGCPPQEWQDGALAYSNVPNAVPSDWLQKPIPDAWDITEPESFRQIGQWRRITGRVREVYQSRQMLFLNFGEDWKKDFTIAIPKEAWKAFDMERLNTFAGAEVRVRGYIESYYGPRIVLLNPQMLEVIGEADAPT